MKIGVSVMSSWVPASVWIGLAITAMTATPASAQPAMDPPRHSADAPAVRLAAAVRHRSPRARRAKLRRSRGTAAQEAARLGALIGHCQGKAAMQRNERQWVVLCSNGKAYVVEPSGPHVAGAPPFECSLGGPAQGQPCFAW